jgi:ATP-dependent Clp protease ATP-binding subunit ClpB
LLLALVKEDDQFTTSALLKQNVKYTDILSVVKKMREKTGATISRSAENMYDALLKYGIDFTERAEQGKLDPVIGRDDEIRRAIQILSRRTKNNPVLIGDPGGTFLVSSTTNFASPDPFQYNKFANSFSKLDL